LFLGWVDGPPPPLFGTAGRFYLPLPRNHSAVYSVHERMTRQQVLDLYFLDARHKLVELAAFLDRAERATGKDDFRLQAFRSALAKLGGKKKQKARTVLLAFSDLTTKPVTKAESKGATGAWNSKK
jgi:hypothetical protein